LCISTSSRHTHTSSFCTNTNHTKFPVLSRDDIHMFGIQSAGLSCRVRSAVPDVRCLTIKAVRCFETSWTTHQTAQRHIPTDLKSDNILSEAFTAKLNEILKNIICTPLNISKKKSLKLIARPSVSPSVRHLVQADEGFVEFSWNSAEKCLKISSKSEFHANRRTDVLYFRVQMRFYMHFSYFVTIAGQIRHSWADVNCVRFATMH
jgi:hypothetical protein